MTAPVVVIDGEAMSNAVDHAEAIRATRLDMDDDTYEVYGARVDNGIAFLDENVPGWIEKVDEDTLDLMSPCLCMLGQVEGDFYEALLKHNHARWSPFIEGRIEADWEWAVQHGFAYTSSAAEINFMEARQAYADLTTVWRERIALRRMLDELGNPDIVAPARQQDLVGV